MINAQTGDVAIHGCPVMFVVAHSDLDHRKMKKSLVFTFITLITFVSDYSVAGSNPRDFIGPNPGIVHVYEGYSGGPTKVWGLTRTATDELITLVETSLPPHALPENERHNKNKSHLLLRYKVDHCQVISKHKTGDHVLLDMCNDEWTYRAKLHIGMTDEKEQVATKTEKIHDIVCRILSRKVVNFHKTEREVILVGYSFINQNKQQSLGSAYFVEGIGPLIGNLDESFQCIQANHLELEAMRQFIQTSTDNFLK